MFGHWCLSGTIFLLLRHNLSLNYSPSTYFTFQTFIILSLPNHLFAIDRHTNLFFSQANSAWDSSFAVKKRRACSRSSQLQLWDNSAILRPKKILHLIAYACIKVRPDYVILDAGWDLKLFAYIQFDKGCAVFPPFLELFFYERNRKQGPGFSF